MATLSVASEKIILTKEELKHIIEIAVRDALRSYQEVAEDVWQWPDPATLSVDTPVSNMKGDDEFLPVFEDPDEAALEEIKLPSNCASLEMWGTAIVMAGQKKGLLYEAAYNDSSYRVWLWNNRKKLQAPAMKDLANYCSLRDLRQGTHPAQRSKATRPSGAGSASRRLPTTKTT
jgi:hypothetical protein